MHEAARAKTSSTTRAAQDRRWHNPLPAWIEQDPAWGRMRTGSRLLLQAIADACDAPDGAGHMVGAFGGAEFFSRMTGMSVRTYWKHIHKLLSAGMVVLLARGGNVRVHFRGGSCTAGNTYGIPGSKGGLNHKRSVREVVQVVRRSDGHMTREVLQPGDQASFWSRADTSAVQKRHGTHVKTTCPPCRNDTLPSPIPSPVPSPVLKDHDHGCESGGAARGEKWDGTLVRKAVGLRKHPHVRLEDLTDTRRLVELHVQFCQADLIGPGEADLLWFAGAAEHALRVGEKNACGLFVATVKNKAQRVLWVTQADEDAAHRRIKAWRHGA